MPPSRPHSGRAERKTQVARPSQGGRQSTYPKDCSKRRGQGEWLSPRHYPSARTLRPVPSQPPGAPSRQDSYFGESREHCHTDRTGPPRHTSPCPLGPETPVGSSPPPPTGASAVRNGGFLKSEARPRRAGCDFLAMLGMYVRDGGEVPRTTTVGELGVQARSWWNFQFEGRSPADSPAFCSVQSSMGLGEVPRTGEGQLLSSGY